MQSDVAEQRGRVANLTSELEAASLLHKDLVRQLNSKVADPVPEPATSFSIDDILAGKELPISLGSLLEVEKDYELGEEDKRLAEERLAVLQSGIKEAVQSLFGQAAASAKAFKEAQAEQLKRILKKRKVGKEGADLGSAGGEDVPEPGGVPGQGAEEARGDGSAPGTPGADASSAGRPDDAEASTDDGVLARAKKVLQASPPSSAVA
eukprot:3462938-Pyramimonas_sp.AAC.1